MNNAGLIDASATPSRARAQGCSPRRVLEPPIRPSQWANRSHDRAAR